jgi:cell division transport system permease protein
MRGYFFRQAWQNLNQNPWMNAVTLGTIALSFLILGIFLVIIVNAQGLMEEWRSRIRITVYLVDSMSREETIGFQNKIRGYTEVQEVSYRSKEEALKTLEERLLDRKGLLKGLSRNPLPASVEIQLKPEYQNSIGVQNLAEKLRGLPQIEDLQYGVEWVEKFSAFIVLLKVLGLAVGGLLLASTIFVISNTIRLNIFSRREEIEIMRSVGATGFFIRAPFYIEGVLQGLVGASLAVAILFILFHLFLAEVYAPLQALLGGFPLFFLTPPQTAALALGGVALGFLGTQVYVGRYLRV